MILCCARWGGILVMSLMVSLAADVTRAHAFRLMSAGGSLGFGYQDYWLDSLRATALEERLSGNFDAFMDKTAFVGIGGGLNVSRINTWGTGWMAGPEIFNIGYNLTTQLSPRRRIPVTLFVSQFSSDLGPLTSPYFNSLVTTYGGTAFFPLANIFRTRKNLPSFGLRLEEIDERVRGSSRSSRSRDQRGTLTFSQGLKWTRWSGKLEANNFADDVDGSGYRRTFLFLEDSTPLPRNVHLYVNGRAENRTYRASTGETTWGNTYGSSVNINYAPRPEYNGNMNYGLSLGEFKGGVRSEGHTLGLGVNLRHLPELSSTHNINYAVSIQEAGGSKSTSSLEGVGSQVSYNKNFRPFGLQSFYRILLQSSQTDPQQTATSLGQGVGSELSRSLGRFSGFAGYEFQYTQPLPSSGTRDIGHVGNVGVGGPLTGRSVLNSILYITRRESFYPGGSSGADIMSMYIIFASPWIGANVSANYSRPFPAPPGHYALGLTGSLSFRPPVRGLSIDIQTQFQILPAFAYTPRLRLSSSYQVRSIILRGYYEYNQAAFGVLASHVVFVDITRNFRFLP